MSDSQDEQIQDYESEDEKGNIKVNKRAGNTRNKSVRRVKYQSKE